MTQAELHCAALVKESDRSRYYASLHAPADLRPAVQALYAFDLETLSIQSRVSEAMPGEIRLQWWRDSIDALYVDKGQPAGHPVIDGLRQAILRGNLPQGAFHRFLDARILHLYSDPLEWTEDLEGHFGDTFSAIIQMSCLVLGRGENPGTANAAGHGGVAAGICWMLRNLGRNAAAGQSFIPKDILARHKIDPAHLADNASDSGLKDAVQDLSGLARQHLTSARTDCRRLDPETRPAFAHLAVVSKELHALAAANREPFSELRALSPLGQFVRIYRAARWGF